MPNAVHQGLQCLMQYARDVALEPRDVEDASSFVYYTAMGRHRYEQLPDIASVSR